MGGEGIAKMACHPKETRGAPRVPLAPDLARMGLPKRLGGFVLPNTTAVPGTTNAYPASQAEDEVGRWDSWGWTWMSLSRRGRK